MNTPSQPDQKAAAPGTSEHAQSASLGALFDRLKDRLKEIYFFGGVALVLVGFIAAAGSQTAGPAFAGLGLCVAGGMCFVASAIIHGLDSIGNRGVP